jgi:hypothetical protein
MLGGKMEIRLSITQIGDTEAGIITVTRVDTPKPVEMGKVRFEDVAEQKWLLMVLMEFHPYVSLDEGSRSYDPAVSNLFKGCCDH